MAIDLQPILCPSCYRQGKTTELLSFRAHYNSPVSRTPRTIFVYECHVCAFHVTQHEHLFHEYRALYNRALRVLLHIRGWVKSKTNSPPGIVWVINRAVETFMEESGMGQELLMEDDHGERSR